jgi:hypothetical protein
MRLLTRNALIVVGAVVVLSAAAAFAPSWLRGLGGQLDVDASVTILILVALLIAVVMFVRSGQKEEPNRPLTALAVLLLLGPMLALWFGRSSRVASGTPPERAVPLAAVLLAVAAASTIVGGFVGFLFGIPRFDYGTTNPPDAGTTTSALASPTSAARATARGRVKPSNSLEDIADWLTKIIVGVGLVQLADIGPKLSSLASYVVPNCSAPCAEAPFVAALVVYSSVGGLLFGYIWTRLHYGKLAALSLRDIDQALREEEQRSAAAFGVGKEPTFEGARGQGVGVPVAAADPNAGKFGGRAVRNGRALRAIIEPSETGKQLYRIYLTVSSTVRDRPLVGMVTFHLHPTFREPVVSRPVENGIASLTLIAYGAFTVGVTADGGATQLELNLADNPDAPDDFKSR